jgi:uncharacterized protein YjbJ (UPF0337 family)
MNKDTVQGGMEKLTGRLKEAVGNATDNDQLTTEGQADQVKGGVRETFGKAKDVVSDAADHVANR